MNAEKEKQLKLHAANVRKMALEAVYSAGSGHPGGSLSVADILTYLYMEKMNVDPQNPKSEDRDRFVLSKGHCSPALYGALAERGFIPKEDLKTFRHVLKLCRINVRKTDQLDSRKIQEHFLMLMTHESMSDNRNSDVFHV